MANKGKCNYCGNEYQKRGMTRHLKACMARKESFEPEHMKSTINRYGYFTIKVENRWDDRFWMYVMAREDATLELLDHFFRGIWLECCGHLSQFTIGHDRFISCYHEEGYHSGNDTYGMDVKLCGVIGEGMNFEYVYDFGDSSYLDLNIMEYTGELPLDGAIYVSARNNPVYKDKPNSPRLGMCGYVGDEDYDYSRLDVDDYEVTDYFTQDNDYEDGEVGDDSMPVETEAAVSAKVEYLEALDNQKLEAVREYNEFIEHIDENILCVYKPIYSMNMMDILRRFSMEGLVALCSQYGIRQVGKRKKGDIISLMVDRIPPMVLDNLKYLSSSQLNGLGRLLDSREMESFEYAFNTEYEPLLGITATYRMLVFLSVEFIDDNEVVFCALPKRVRKLFNEYGWKNIKKIGQRNDLWINLTKGMLYYYGIMDVEMIASEIERVTGQTVDREELGNVLEIEFNWNESFEKHKSMLVHWMVEDPELLLKEIKSARRQNKGLEYRKLSKAEMLQAKGDYYFENTSAFDELKKYMLENYEMNSRDADDAILEFLDDLDRSVDQNRMQKSVNDFIGRFGIYSMEDANIFAKYVIDVFNDYRRWWLLGNSPADFFEVNLHIMKKEEKPENKLGNNAYYMKAKRKIGRNEPCPCGSGKKYKKCCGR